MADDNNSISIDDIEHKLFITQEFIEDCKDSTATLTLFYAIFTKPFYVKDGVQTSYGSESIPVMYNPTWGQQWRNVGGEQAVLVCEMPGSVSGNFVEGGFLPSDDYYLAVDFDTTHNKLKVRIPYFSGLTSQTCGILKYKKSGQSELKDAFVFNTKALNVGVIGFVLNTENNDDYPTSVEQLAWNQVIVEGDESETKTEIPENYRDLVKSVEVNNENNDSVLYIDLSKLNIAATLKPAYTKVNDESSVLYSGWYTDEHLHNLYAVIDRPDRLAAQNDGSQNNFGNIGSFTYDLLGKTEVMSNILNPNFTGTVENSTPSTIVTTDSVETLAIDSIGRLYKTSVLRGAHVSSSDKSQQVDLVERTLGGIEQDLPPTTDATIEYNPGNEDVTKVYEDLKLMYLKNTYIDPESLANEIPIDIFEIYEL